VPRDFIKVVVFLREVEVDVLEVYSFVETDTGVEGPVADDAHATGSLTVVAGTILIEAVNFGASIVKG